MSDTAVADWYPDPLDRFSHRYWDGQAWTEHVASDGVQETDPLPQLAPPTALGVNAKLETEVATQPVGDTTLPPSEGGKHRAGLASRLGSRAEAVVTSKVEEVRVSRRMNRLMQDAPSLVEMVRRLQLEEPRHPLDEQIEVAGETYAVKGIKKAFREVGMPITAKGSTIEEIQVALIPEPWNPHDSNAVAVVVGEHHVGYVPAEIAPSYAGGLGRLAANGYLATGIARIWAKHDGGVVRARVTVLFPEADVFQ